MTVFSKQSVIITGAAGMLGRAFVEALGQTKAGAVHAFSHADLDVCDRDKVMGLADVKPDLIVHCAANVNAEYCETHPEECRAVQVGGTENVLELAEATGATVLYPQSFLIFDGRELPITETTTPNPLSVYGRCKLDAERLLLDRWADRSLIVRMAGFFGGDDADKNFVGKFVPHLKKLIDQGIDHFDVGDRVWQPTYTLDLARNCLALAAADKTGLYVMSSHGEASFFQLAASCVEILGIGHRMTINPVSESAVARDENAKRPPKAIIDNVRLRADGLDLQRPWRDALEDYLRRPYFRKMFEGLSRTEELAHAD